MAEEQTTEHRENPLFGRKVFFVNPPLAVENNIISELRDEEYEVYVIHDYRLVKPVLYDNKDALIFLYIDDQLTYNQWFNYIKSFQNDEKIKSIFIGVLSSKAGYEDQQRFMLDLSLPGGFIMLNEHIEITHKKLKGILDINGAKGRRQYIRLDCKTLADVKGHLTTDNKMFTFNIDNISSVGLACIYSQEYVNLFQKSTLQHGISIQIGNKVIPAPSVVFDTRIVNNNGFSVLLFTNNVHKSTKQTIKAYIFDVLDANLKNILDNSIQDLTVYSDEIKHDENQDIPQYQDIMDSFINILDGDLPELPDLK